MTAYLISEIDPSSFENDEDSNMEAFGFSLIG